MLVLYFANLVVLAVAAWALWERRHSIYARADAPLTIGIALFAVGAALDSPWPEVARASYPLTGKFYLLMALGHISYLIGAAMGIKAVYMRLMPDDAIGPFMRSRIMPVVAAAAVMLAVCLMQSGVTSTMSVDHLYLAAPDHWLSAYWVVFVGALIALEAVTIYGEYLLRSDTRSCAVNFLIASQVVGTIACLCIGYVLLTGRDDVAQILIWPLAYAGIIGGAIAATVSWRRRVASMFTPEGSQQVY